MQLLLGRRNSAAVSVTRGTAYPDGFELNPDVNVRTGLLDVAYQHPAEAGRLFDGGLPTLTPSFLRFGLERPDGSRATNLEQLEEIGHLTQLDDDGPPGLRVGDDALPRGPVLR